jgi:hypothetical protein
VYARIDRVSECAIVLDDVPSLISGRCPTAQVVHQARIHMQELSGASLSAVELGKKTSIGCNEKHKAMLKDGVGEVDKRVLVSLVCLT